MPRYKIADEKLVQVAEILGGPICTGWGNAEGVQEWIDEMPAERIATVIALSWEIEAHLA